MAVIAPDWQDAPDAECHRRAVGGILLAEALSDLHILRTTLTKAQ